jgi:hypothetical protein
MHKIYTTHEKSDKTPSGIVTSLAYAGEGRSVHVLTDQTDPSLHESAANITAKRQTKMCI